MKRNIEKTCGLIFSQRLLIMLVEKGLTREKAYQIVQTNAMKARGKTNLKDMVSKDPVIKKYLSMKDLESAFDINYYLRNTAEIYRRIGI
jgi:adenylosuccinate lyase